MHESIARHWSWRPPLWRLTVIALAARLVAAFFSAGYFAHDDHFLVIEAAQSWADGHDYNNWLPWNQGDDARPSGHSFFYVGLHFLLFKLLNAAGPADPAWKMLVVRLLHALWSLVAVRAGYRIALKLSDERTAWTCGLFLALFFFMPFVAVRQLVEVACIPFLMLGVERLLVFASNGNDPQRATNSSPLRTAFIAGIFLGLAINVRFQTLFFAAGPGLVLLFRNWRAAMVYGLGVLLPIAVIQGSIDSYFWGRPFAEITEYVAYNFANATTYGKLPWYNYLLLLAGVFIPPFSLAVFFGFFSAWRRHLLVWMAIFLFLAAHSWFPNKQERFILPIVPLFFIIGFCAWERWRAASAWWTARPRLWRGVMVWTWALNVALLVPLSFSYSKRSRCEAVYSLRHEPWARGIAIEDAIEHEPPQVPLFYWGRWEAQLVYVPDTIAEHGNYLQQFTRDGRVNVVFFIGQEDLDHRIRWMEQWTGPLVHVRDATPGLLDRIMHGLNPVNRNETISIYRITDAKP